MPLSGSHLIKVWGVRNVTTLPLLVIAKELFPIDPRYQILQIRNAHELISHHKIVIYYLKLIDFKSLALCVPFILIGVIKFRESRR